MHVFWKGGAVNLEPELKASIDVILNCRYHDFKDNSSFKVKIVRQSGFEFDI